MYRILTVIFAVLIFAGCRSETNTSDKIPVNFEDNGRFIPVIDEIIPLETNDTFLIGNNYAFKTTAKYYILGDSEKILVFDKTGKAQSVISPIGQGPNETSSVSFFHAGDNSIMIAAIGRKQIYEYDFEGNFIQAYNTSDNYFDFVSFNDLFLFDSQSRGTVHGNVLSIINKEGETVNDTIPIIAEGTNYGKDKIQVYDEYALFLPTMSDIIYKIGPTGHVSAAYSFDFGRYWLDSKESSEVSAN
ncbi:MAG: 6-bladed beta-propeller, partial [Bacteroidales bacterium]|nr:6-bladed beta-propeller [Bacteroidales bacterium]